MLTVTSWVMCSIPSDLLDPAQTPSTPNSAGMSWEPTEQQLDAVTKQHLTSHGHNPSQAHHTGSRDDTPQSISAWQHEAGGMPSELQEGRSPTMADDPLAQAQISYVNTAGGATSVTVRDGSRAASRSTPKPRTKLAAGKLAPQGKLFIPTTPSRDFKAPPPGLRHTAYRLPPAAVPELSDVPDAARPNTAKLRRLQAACVSQSGPPKGVFKLRELSPEPQDCVLGAAKLLAACDLDEAYQAQVSTALRAQSCVCHDPVLPHHRHAC